MVRKVRRQINFKWFIISLFLMVSVSGLFVLSNISNISHQSVQQIKTTAVTAPEVSSFLPPFKHPTKSMTELEPMDELNPYVLFFNRVPNCGSEIIVLLLQLLQGSNKFKHVRLKDSKKRKLNIIEQEKLVYEVTDILKEHAVPTTLDYPVYFVNFSSYDHQSPTFINFIRDPSEKFMSRYHYESKSKKSMTFKTLEECIDKKYHECTFKNEEPYDLTIPYFCGQENHCMLLNNKMALKTAMQNVEKYYPVIGILEELNTTLEVFEHKLPFFFKGAQNLYYKHLLKQHQHRKPTKISKTVQDYFKNVFIAEYEFYEWIKKRLFNQLQVLYGDHHH